MCIDEHFDNQCRRSMLTYWTIVAIVATIAYLDEDILFYLFIEKIKYTELLTQLIYFDK